MIIRQRLSRSGTGPGPGGPGRSQGTQPGPPGQGRDRACEAASDSEPCRVSLHHCIMPVMIDTMNRARPGGGHPSHQHLSEPESLAGPRHRTVRGILPAPRRRATVAVRGRASGP